MALTSPVISVDRCTPSIEYRYRSRGRDPHVLEPQGLQRLKPKTLPMIDAVRLGIEPSSNRSMSWAMEAMYWLSPTLVDSVGV